MKKYISVMIVSAILLLSGCNVYKNYDTRFLADTVCTLSIKGSEDILSLCFEEAQQIAIDLSCHDEGYIYALNDTGGGEIISEYKKIIEKSIYYAEKYCDKFDITLYPVNALWDFENCVVPDSEKLTSALCNVDYHRISIENNYINLNGTRLDLGAVAKGYIADCMAQYLDSNGVTDYLINFGSTIIVNGKRKNVNIRYPDSSSHIAYTLRIKNKCVSTSGTYERVFEQNGTKYHHIIDSTTGYPVETDIASATVVTDNGLTGDILSTICVLLGSEAAINMVREENIPAVFILNNNEIIKINTDEVN